MRTLGLFVLCAIVLFTGELDSIINISVRLQFLLSNGNMKHKYQSRKVNREFFHVQRMIVTKYLFIPLHVLKGFNIYRFLNFIKEPENMFLLFNNCKNLRKKCIMESNGK